MDELLKAQLRHQMSLGKNPSALDYDDKICYIRELCLAVNVEVTEFLQELPWKPWRSIEDQHVDHDMAREEIVDIMIFTLNLWLQINSMCSKPISLKNAILSKQLICIERIENKYNKIGD